MNILLLLVGSRFSTVFFLVGSPMSVVVTYLSDKYNRKSVLMTISTLCHLSCFIIPFSKSYYPILLWRAFSGVCIISSLPIFLSTLGDVFPANIRSIASVISSTVVGFGMLAGQTISGFLSSRFGWQFFYRVIPLFGLAAVIVLFCMYHTPLFI